MLLIPFLPTVESRAEDNHVPEDLTSLSLEDLMDLSITSVSKRPQKMSDAAAAVFVITQEDIRRSGATSIPELLRMVPGVEVARIDASKWAITARGFNGRFANKLLVLFDGRTVYSPLYSGVFWDLQNYVLEDLDRIEVIRGPGASLWGANAVNGVINIMTKKSRDTQGGLLIGAYGDHEGFGAGRYGGKVGEGGYYRIYSKYYEHSGFPAVRNIDREDDWDYFISGFRFDSDLSSQDTFTFQGDFINRNANETYFAPSAVPPAFSERLDSSCNAIGGNALARWTHIVSESSSFQVQTYYDRVNLGDQLLSNKRDTFDLDFQHQFKLENKQSIIWGLGYRLDDDRNHTGTPYLWLKSEHENNLFSAFLQNEIQIIENRLLLTLGSRFEHNDRTGFEIQPNARLLWTPSKHHSVWTAVSRAVRTPSWAEEDVQIDREIIPPNPLSPLPTLVTFTGQDDFDSEELYAFEAGYRFMPFEHLSFDIAAFYNSYDDLRSVGFGSAFLEGTQNPHIVLPLNAENKLEAETWGVEVAADWQALKWLRLQAAYTFLEMSLSKDEGSTDPYNATVIEGSNPHHQFSLRSWVDLPFNTQFDMWLRYVDALPAVDIGCNVDNFITLDVRFAWKPFNNLELSIVGQNLLDRRHVEFKPDFLWSVESEIERSIYGKVVWRF